jgi:hypothetical protein
VDQPAKHHIPVRLSVCSRQAVPRGGGQAVPSPAAPSDATLVVPTSKTQGAGQWSAAPTPTVYTFEQYRGVVASVRYRAGPRRRSRPGLRGGQAVASPAAPSYQLIPKERFLY